MKKFAFELWHDLREKRLWPVAVVLAVAIVAVPVMLKKSAGATPAPTTSAVPADSKPVVSLADASAAGAGSKLQVFSSKDPFKPSASVLRALRGSQPSSSTPSGSSAPASPPSGGSTPPSSPPAGGNGGGSGGTTPTSPKPDNGAYTYTVDVKVGLRGSEKTKKGVARLDVLPSDRAPLLVFLGVNSTRDTAVFLLDNTLQAAGEGRCKPSKDVCSFLYLKVDRGHNQEDFVQSADDGTQTEYSIQLLAINRVPTSQVAKAAKRSAAARKSAQAYAKKGKATPFRFLFDIPAFADEVGN